MPYIYTSREGFQGDFFSKEKTTPNSFYRGTYSAILENVTSYRTDTSDVKGTEIPDFIMEPWAWFITDSTRRKREEAIKKYGERYKTHKFHSGGTGLPVRAPDNLPHVDTGHAFNLERLKSTTNRMGHYTWHSSSGQQKLCEGNILFSRGARIKASQYSRMPFDFHQSATLRGTFMPLTKVPPSVDVGYWSQRAIKTLAPTSPAVDLTAFFGELLEGISLPLMLLMKDSFKDIRVKQQRENKKRRKAVSGIRTTKVKVKDKTLALAGEWVGLNFSFIPLLSDIMTIADTLMSAQERLDQYVRDSHRGIRRDMTLLEELVAETFNASDLDDQGQIGSGGSIFPKYREAYGPGSSYNVLVDKLSSKVVMSRKTKIWFSGSFTYYLPQRSSSAGLVDGFVKNFSLLYGKGLTPEALWQLTPWSWLLDWFFDIQSTISAHQRMSEDNLVLNYGYLMCETEFRATQVSSFASHPNRPVSVNQVSTTVSSVRKERHRANPYGFGIKTPASLNAKQVSILAALGVTRL